MDLDDVRWLLDRRGQRLLAAATEVRDDGPPAGPVGAAAYGGPGAGAAALTQARLRARAAAKFGDARRPACTSPPTGLEQATRLAVARAPRRPGARVGRDDAWSTSAAASAATCVALAHAGLTAAGVDLDPRAGRGRRGQPRGPRPRRCGVGGRCDRPSTPPRFDVAYADPARRTAQGRTFDVDDCTPPWSFVERCWAATPCVKLAPGLPHELVPDGRRGRVGQRPPRGQGGGALVGTAGHHRPPRDRDRRRRPGHAHRRGRPRRHDRPGGGVPLRARRCGDPGRPGHRRGGRRARPPLDEHIAYVASEQSFRTPFARGYRVLEEVPFREKPLKAALRERGVGRLTIKKRGRLGRPRGAAAAPRRCAATRRRRWC